MASGISSNLIGGASLANMPLASGTTAFGTSFTASPTTAGMTAYLSSYLARERTFARNLGVARKKGLSPVDAANIAQMGLDQGGPIAAALAHSSRSQVRHISALDAQITATSGQLGNQAAGAVYDRQVVVLERVEKLLEHLPGAFAKALTSPHATKALATHHTRAKRSK
jgi:hypothetical protein